MGFRHRASLAGIALAALACPSGGAAADLTERQAALLANNCLQCHARPGIGVPQIGDANQWKPRARQGEERLLVNVVQGLRGMPPRGYCTACTERDLRALIRWMAGLP